MATFNDGILGGFSGTVGTVVGTTWRGVPVMRSKPKKSNKKPSPAQLRNQLKFKMANTFLNPLKPFLNESFDQPQKKKSRFDLAKSYFLIEAMIPTADSFIIDYLKVLISKGPIRGLLEASVTTQGEQKALLQWTDNSALGLAYAEDTLSVIAYVPATQDFIFFEAAAQRHMGEVVLQFPEELQGLTLEVWATFKNTALKQYSISDYLGSITVL
ncbi:DUF6266 family protein [Marixanthomonas spongiae]|uniref:Uncharacterized protein n=1 Tax=Marixanthomonas spongiae TaxID=2174845 RepID=A0A2U0HYI7_9FLAO|nr:DUF6266 family protein [Marixanthomonas spongiae]PVW13896.1 hypothetical protein DDV96_12145 [Marixanthomonas spongiae]